MADVVKRKLVCISGGVYAPSSRYRVDALADQLRARGWEVQSIHAYGVWDHRIKQRHLLKAYRGWCKLWRALRTAMLDPGCPVLVQRLAVPVWSWPERRLARRAPVVFDFDDAIFLDGQQRASRSRENALQQVMRSAACVIAGNQWLASHVPKGCDVHVIPTCIDMDTYRPAEERGDPDQPIRIGWIGTASNFRHLRRLEAPLKRLREEFPGRIQFCLCSNVRDEELLAGLDAEFIAWSAESEVSILRSFDVGVMPLKDEDWCRGKCAFKLIQYMAMGLATVSSAVGMNCEVVQDGSNGLLVDESGWYDALKQLVQQPELRQRMGAAARSTATERFSLARAVEQYEQIFASLVQEDPSK